MSVSILRVSIAFLFAFLVGARELGAQQGEIPARHVPYSLHAGPFENPASQEAVVYEHVMNLGPGVPWARLLFESADLPGESYLRVTSLLDADFQTLSAQELVQWGRGTAYFNGGSFLIEIVAGPRTSGLFLDMEEVLVGDRRREDQFSICDMTDNRGTSTRPEVARLLTARQTDITVVGVCTGFMINVPANHPDKCFLSAGHCFVGGAVTIAQFNVPNSNVNCNLVMSAAAKQFVIDPATVQMQIIPPTPTTTTTCGIPANIGNDWAKFHCFRNANTGKFAFEEQGSALSVFVPTTTTPNIPANGMVRIPGYGVDGNGAGGAGGTACVCATTTPTTMHMGTLNYTQQEHNAAYTFDATAARPFIAHLVDTCGGNSGSPIIMRSGTFANLVLGIHTCGGCTTMGTNANTGTPITQNNLRNAIANREGAGTPYCFGNGSGTPCPCGNNDPGGFGGCRNSSGDGALLGAVGSNSIGADDVVLFADRVRPGQPGLFFQGNNQINGGNGIQFGDGLRCCGSNVIRLQVVVPDANGHARTSQPILGTSPPGTTAPGDTRCYQFWYRDPPTSPCGFLFNLTNGYSIAWAP